MTGSAPLPELRRYSQESLDRKEAIPGGAVASVHILTSNRKSANVASRAGGPQLCPVLLGEAGLEDPTSRG